MDELLELFALLAGLYLLESLLATRRFGLAFVRRWPGLYRAARPFTPGPDDRLGLILADVLPPLNPAFASQLFPITLSPDGLDADSPFSFPPGRHLWPSGSFLRFEQIERVVADGPKLRINGEVFAYVAGPSRARELAHKIEAWRKAERPQREREITEFLRSFHDDRAAAQRLETLRRETVTLRGVCIFLLFGLFVFSPVLIWQWGMELIWPVLLAVLVPTWIAAVALFWRAERRLQTTPLGTRIERTLTMIALPVAAARASDFAARHALTTFHPLAIARHLLPPERFHDLAGQIWRDAASLRLRAERMQGDATRQAAAEWFCSRVRIELEALLVRCTVWPADLEQPPQREDGSCLAYCPRCREQSRIAEGECPFCSGVALQPFEALNAVRTI